MTNPSGSTSVAQTVPVLVKEGVTTYLGDLYFPKDPKGPLPLVIVIHEWWGKNDYPAARARMIVDELGCAALAVDLYGEGKTVETPAEAGALARPFFQDGSIGVSRLKLFAAAAPEAAKKASASIDESRIAAIGYCFGGTQALNLARSGGLERGQRLLGVVSFHSGLGSNLKAKPGISTKLLVLHGEADEMISDDEVRAFKAEMKEAGADLEFHAYAGAQHAFTNPKATAVGKKHGIPLAYDEKTDKESWSEMKGFLKKVFSSSPREASG